MIETAFVLSLWSAVNPAYGHGIGRERIARAIVEAVSDAASKNDVPSEFQDEKDAVATIAYYVAKESMVSENPTPFSWDAKAGVSCGILQEPCAFVRTHSLKEQAAWWIRNVRDAGLASVDSDPKRAKKRLVEVRKLVTKLESN